MKRIDLAKEYGGQNSKVMSGRDVGKKDRQRLELDHYDQMNEKLIIHISDEVYSVNSSYFLGLFGKSVRQLGEQLFREKYVFECDEVIRVNIEDGVFCALKDSNILE